MKYSVLLLLINVLLLGCAQKTLPETQTVVPTIAVTTTLSPSKIPDNCSLYKDKVTGKLNCFGCVNGVCKKAPPNFELYERPSDYLGIPYACFPTAEGCQLAQ